MEKQKSLRIRTNKNSQKFANVYFLKIKIKYINNLKIP